MSESSKSSLESIEWEYVSSIELNHVELPDDAVISVKAMRERKYSQPDLHEMEFSVAHDGQTQLLFLESVSPSIEHLNPVRSSREFWTRNNELATGKEFFLNGAEPYLDFAANSFFVYGIRVGLFNRAE